jgi:hypothetical protein
MHDPKISNRKKHEHNLYFDHPLPHICAIGQNPAEDQFSVIHQPAHSFSENMMKINFIKNRSEMLDLVENRPQEEIFHRDSTLHPLYNYL